MNVTAASPRRSAPAEDAERGFEHRVMPLARRDRPRVGILGVGVMTMDRAETGSGDGVAEQEANDALDVAREVAVRPAVVEPWLHLVSRQE